MEQNTQKINQFLAAGLGGGNKFSKLSLEWEVIFSRKELIPFESTVFELACKTNINWTLYLKQNIETTSWVNSTIPQKHFSYTRDFFYSRRDPSWVHNFLWKLAWNGNWTFGFNKIPKVFHWRVEGNTDMGILYMSFLKPFSNPLWANPLRPPLDRHHCYVTCNLWTPSLPLPLCPTIATWYFVQSLKKYPS